ncbi:histidine phosphatase family protein [Lachnospiraceae bacterium MD1]|uniref:Histidine phosphatase family protein n=1 Tax=Variimorphobacter saccharofermentans TaxID=2755051 RepID=A0A839JVN7_9FIRM|nr:histidine phosphatase family protein [Variimorphobacter saccharofermentans]MBB2181725.1 histidine phosphatase family protein [Variimorphobacter saccharofermentans]
MWDRAENQITLVLIRHGETKSNKEHRYLGKTDEELSVEGKTHLLKEKEKGIFPNVDFLFSSPMKRCVQTAEILFPELQPVEIEEWKEMDFGVFEGKNYLELQGDKRYQEWIDSNGTLPFPEGESREEFISRCDKGFRRMIGKLKPIKEEGHKTVGIIVHGGTIMALLSKYGKGDYFDYQVPNGKGFICTMKYLDAEPEIMELKKI